MKLVTSSDFYIIKIIYRSEFFDIFIMSQHVAFS